jgi:hypothetical protein
VKCLDKFCGDLKEHLEGGVELAKRRNRCCVMLLLRRMLRREGRRGCGAVYSRMLKTLFQRYQYDRGMYIIPLEDAEKILADIGQLCQSIRSEEKREAKQPKEKMVLVSFHLTKEMLRELDAYAQKMSITRSEAVRMAIRELLKKHQFDEAI